MEVPCLYYFREDSFDMNWVRMKIEDMKLSIDEAFKEERRSTGKLK